MSEFADLHDDLRGVARDVLGATRGADADWRAAADAGWLGLEVPESLGGAGVTFAETAIVLEELGRAAAAVPLLGTAALGVGALLAAEPSARRDELLAATASGELRLAVALGPSGELAEATPPFTLDDAGALRGRADFVLDAPAADVLLLLTMTEAGRHVLLAVPTAAARIEARPVLDETRTLADVCLDGSIVEPSDVLALAEAPQTVLDRAAVAVACDALGLAGAMLDATVAYVGDRRQFDRPIGSFQAVKHQCADMLVTSTVARQLVAAAVAAVSVGAPDAPIAAARAKSYATTMAVDVVGTAMQLHGGIGYTWESGIHVYLKRATLDRALFGSPAAHRRRLATTFVSSP